MRMISFVASLAALALASWAAEEKAEEEVNVDRFVGRELIVEDRAAEADLVRTLPLSCPPFYLRDEYGRIIDPIYAEKEGLPVPTAPVSTKQTCNFCHPYDRVTQGYHFQTGYEELYEPHKLGEPIPLHKGPGFYGKWQVLYQREIAPKHFENPWEIDLTPYEWMRDCGICHPGGGPAEYDRSGKRYAEVMASDREIAQFPDGDYYGAQWDKSGVMEADCFICHLETYEYSYRAQQIKRGNYKWAATAAAGFGLVEGAVDDGEVPIVHYKKDLFGPDGKVTLKIRRPSDRQCLFCHDMSGVQKRGTTWESNYVQDVHSEQGIRCIDCHQGDIRHNFAKGYSSSQTVRDDMDGSMLSCKECHDSDELGAPYFSHPGIPPIHFERLSCETCHITKRPFLPTRMVDTLTGKVVEIPEQPEPEGGNGYELGATWGKLVGPAAIFEPFTSGEIHTAAHSFVPKNSPWREMFLNEDGTSRLPEGPFIVRDLMNQEGETPSVHDEDVRALMLLALEETAVPDEETVAVCIYRGKAYRVAHERLEQLDVKLQPKRVGVMSEFSVYYARSKGDGIIYPEAYQLGVFWAYLDQGVARPIFVEEMKAAWDFLHQEQRRQALVRELGLDKAWDLLPQEEFRFCKYPARPSSGAELPSLPDPTTASETELLEAIRAKLNVYPAEDREPLEVYDDNNDRWPEVNREEEIQLVGWALTQTLERLPEPALYFIRGTTIHRLTVEEWQDPYGGPLNAVPQIPDGEPFIAIERYIKNREAKRFDLAETRLARLYAVKVESVLPDAVPALTELPQRLPWTISHGVEPAELALGAKGCADCHSPDAHFFFGKVMLDPFGPDGKPVTTSMYELLDYDPGALRISAWRESVVKPATIWVVLAVLLLMLIHLTWVGAMPSSSERTSILNVLRFGVPERISHLILMVTIVFLSVTGFLFLLGEHDPFGERSGAYVRWLHTWFGFVSAAGLLGILLLWARSMLFAKGDRKWLAGFGGYFGGHKKYPAGKFNAGQKILFWSSVGVGIVLVVTGVLMYLYRGVHMPNQELIYTIHDVAALLMIVMLLGHIYLAVVVNPHALRSLFGGKVSERWAKEHHPDWQPPRAG